MAQGIAIIILNLVTMLILLCTCFLLPVCTVVTRLGIKDAASALGQENAAKSWAEIESHLSPEQHLIAVVNKIDAGNIDITSLLPEGTTVIKLSARNGEGISALEQALVNASGTGDLSHNDIMVTNARHYEALTHAANAIARAIDGLKAGLSGDFIAQDIRETLHYLGEITGTITTPDILATIFSRFCIGK